MKVETKFTAAGSAGTAGSARRKSPLVWAALLLFLSLSLLFWRCYDRDYVHFSNDGPLGAMVAEQNRMPSIMTGMWSDLNWLGWESLSPSPSVTSFMRLVTTPFMYA